jgi:hypothetical protein
MKNTLLKILALFISLSCICGICSKGDESGSDDTSNNNPNNPVLKPEDTWVYFEDCRGLVVSYSNFYNRPLLKKWIATKVGIGHTGTYADGAYLVWGFENSGDTRFLLNEGNPGGKEAFSISLKKFKKVPGPGTYQLDIDYKEGYCWYYVYTSSGTLHDSTRTQGISNSQFNITSMVFDREMGSTVDRYKITGTGTFNIMYWQNGTGSTTDIHTLQCTFNNVFVDFPK